MNDLPIHIKRARVIDPKNKRDEELDIIVENGVIARIGKGLAAPGGARIVDASRLVATPGFIDLHAHLREPGEEYKEDIETASRSAAAGGFSAVCAMPNTKPTNDTRAVTELIVSRAREVSGVRVYPVGAVSMGLRGEQLTEIGELKDAGVVALSDDGKPVMNSRLMRRALEYARTFDLPLSQHAEDLHLSEDGVMNEGPCSTRAGLKGQPSQSESAMVARDIELVELTGARYHVAHISTKAAIDLVRSAKRRGLPVTCEVTPHHLSLTDEACLGYDTSTKVNPPLRTGRDIDALIEALADGTIDAVATDHAPHSTLEKTLEFSCAAFGMIGFETAWPLVYRLVKEGRLSLTAAVEKFTANPARVFSLPGGSLYEGGPADITLLDLDAIWQVDVKTLKSKSQNTPFAGWEMPSKPVATMVQGRFVYEELAR